MRLAMCCAANLRQERKQCKHDATQLAERAMWKQHFAAWSCQQWALTHVSSKALGLDWGALTNQKTIEDQCNNKLFFTFLISDQDQQNSSGWAAD